jgi:hypothetical protein
MHGAPLAFWVVSGVAVIAVLIEYLVDTPGAFTGAYVLLVALAGTAYAGGERRSAPSRTSGTETRNTTEGSPKPTETSRRTRTRSKSGRCCAYRSSGATRVATAAGLRR